MYEEGEDAQHDGGREELACADQVEGQGRVEGGLFGDFGAGAGGEHRWSVVGGDGCDERWSLWDYVGRFGIAVT